MKKVINFLVQIWNFITKTHSKTFTGLAGGILIGWNMAAIFTKIAYIHPLIPAATTATVISIGVVYALTVLSMIILANAGIRAIARRTR